MPRITAIKVEPFASTQGDIAQVQYISRNFADDIAHAVECDHYCEDSTCDIHHALEAGAPITAAGILSGATECAHVDAVTAAHWFNGTLTYDGRRDMYQSPDWPVWEAYHREHGRRCSACEAYTYDDSDTCGNCLAALEAR